MVILQNEEKDCNGEPHFLQHKFGMGKKHMNENICPKQMEEEAEVLYLSLYYMNMYIYIDRYRYIDIDTYITPILCISI